MLRIAIGLASVVWLAASAAPLQMAPAVRSELAPSGTLRIGINYGNLLYVEKDPSTGEAHGIAIDLVAELKRRIGIPIEFVGYQSAGQLAEGAQTTAWDVAFFLGLDPERSDKIDFTAAIMDFDITYMVRGDSTIRTIADVDRDGVRIAVSARSIYDLQLTRTLKHAQLMRIPGPEPSFQLFVKDKLDALAGPRTILLANVPRLPGSRVLDGKFMTGQFAIGVPKGRPAAAKYMREFNEGVKASGLVAQAIAKHKIAGVSVAARGAGQ
jgi:polar amino acid transport system substrate-binding protein